MLGNDDKGDDEDDNDNENNDGNLECACCGDSHVTFLENLIPRWVRCHSSLLKY